jgi:L-serine kinase (ADP)
MKANPEFRLVPLRELHAHEQIVESEARKLTDRIRDRGIVDDPIWVARGSLVILNGHHRVTALRALGAERAPAWVVVYDSDEIELARWSPGPPLSKAEVVRRATSGELFPPKTTRHVFTLELPRHPTPLSELGAGAPVRSPEIPQRRASDRSRPSASDTPGPG